MNNTVKPLVSFRLVRSPVCGFVQVYNLDVVMKLYRIVKKLLLGFQNEHFVYVLSNI